MKTCFPEVPLPHDMDDREREIEVSCLGLMLWKWSISDVAVAAFVIARLEALLGEETGEPFETVLGEAWDLPKDTFDPPGALADLRRLYEHHPDPES
jgi:hypothetical protein